MNEQRDAELGARLDELEVQEHGPGYWEGVMAAAEPELERLRAGAAADDAGLARPATLAQPGRAQAAQSGRRRLFGGRRWLWVPAAAAVAAAAALVLLIGLPGGGYERRHADHLRRTSAGQRRRGHPLRPRRP